MHSKLNFAPAKVEALKRADGSLLLRSPQPLGPHARCVTEWLGHWSDAAPDRTFLAERKGENWRQLSDGQIEFTVRQLPTVD